MVNYYSYETRPNKLAMKTYYDLFTARKNNEYIILDIQCEFGESFEEVLSRVDIRIRNLVNEIRMVKQ